MMIGAIFRRGRGRGGILIIGTRRDIRFGGSVVRKGGRVSTLAFKAIRVRGRRIILWSIKILKR
jgi:hypothetical protein